MNKSSRGFAPILIVLIISLIAGIGYLVLNATSPPFPQPTLAPESNEKSTTSWKNQQIENCGHLIPKTYISFSIPSNWNVSTEESDYWAKHTFGGTSEQITIACGDGLGGGCDEIFKKEIKLGNETKTACLGEENDIMYLSQLGGFAGAVGFTIEATYANSENSKKLINQILSTFKVLE